MAIAATPLTSFAEEAEETWDGSADTSWYNPDDPKDSYTLTTAEQLAGLAALVNGDIRFADTTIYLGCDMDVSGHEWISIGSGANTPAKAFCGTFDGQGHVISGLYSHEDYISADPNKTEHNTIRTGLFGAVYEGTIQNLGVVEADIAISEKDVSTYGMGILVDWFTNSTMRNCFSTGFTGGSYIEKYIGGLVGFANGDIVIEGCYSQAVITGRYSNSGDYYSNALDYWDSLGGILGASYTGTAAITDCWFDGEIVVESIQAPVGGIVGYAEGAVVENCMVATTALGVDPTETGNTCWIGYLVDVDAQNCYWPDNDTYPVSVANEESGNSAGTAVEDFNDPAVLAGLQTHAQEGITWTAGIRHPALDWDLRNIPADYASVDAALDLMPDDLSLYTDGTVAALEELIQQLDRQMSRLEQDAVSAMADAIRKAIDALEYKGADYTAVDAAIERANALNAADYTNFAGVTQAIQAVVRGKAITEQAAVDAMAKAIEEALAALEKKPAVSQPDDTTNPSTGGDYIPAPWLALLCAGAAGAICARSFTKKRRASLS